ncbi:MAG: hypothetical protein KDC48_22015 [Planctomycetes bacterium]|nr:hypothetical protein [Planctomycetota bacterium]
MKFLKGLLGGGGSGGGSRHAAVEYEGYTIVPTPEQREGGWSTCGIISREVGGETKEHRFVRADTSMSEQGAVDLTVQKARRLIDEQGENLFGGR